MAKNLRNLSRIDHLSLSMRVQVHVPMLSHQMLKLNVYHLNHLQLSSRTRKTWKTIARIEEKKIIDSHNLLTRKNERP